MTKFIFDLDGTVTAEETLPLIASHFGVQEEIELLTKDTINGNIPFIESFIRRVHILGKLPVDEVSSLLSKTRLNTHVVKFILDNAPNCILATGNLNCWISKLVEKLGCAYFCSKGDVFENKVVSIGKILKKEEVVRVFQSQGFRVVFIGDGNNDAEAMRLADVSIASGIVHMPAKSIIPFSRYLIFNELALCRQLNQLL